MTANRHVPVSSRSSGSGERYGPSEPAFLAVGRVLRPHGLRGEVRVEIHTDFPERFAVYGQQLYLSTSVSPTYETCTVYELQSHRFHGDVVLLKFVGIDDRTQAEALRHSWVWIPVEQAVPLKEGELYLHQMLGLQAFTVEGKDLGRVEEIIETGSAPVYVVRGLLGELLLPDIDEVIVDVDIAHGRMTVRLIEGLR